MTEQERRIEHNKQALAMVAAERKRMYSGIVDVEMEPECLTGKAILAVTDDVFNKLPKEAQYTPNIRHSVGKDGKIIQQAYKSDNRPQEKTTDLNLLLC